jgi:glycine betaine/proline transport system substrate-binding protein
MFWAPHWVLSTVDYGWVDMPQDIAEKYALMAVPVWKMGWPGFSETWPGAYRFLEAYQLDNASQEKMMDLIDNQGEDLDQVTEAWVEENRATWQPWVDQAMSGS